MCVPEIISQRTQLLSHKYNQTVGECSNLAPISRKSFHDTEAWPLLFLYIVELENSLNGTTKVQTRNESNK